MGVGEGGRTAVFVVVKGTLGLEVGDVVEDGGRGHGGRGGVGEAQDRQGDGEGELHWSCWCEERLVVFVAALEKDDVSLGCQGVCVCLCVRVRKLGREKTIQRGGGLGALYQERHQGHSTQQPSRSQGQCPYT